MKRTFTIDEEVANRCGFQAAAILSHIAYWIEKNKSNDRHFYDGRTWTYNSLKSFTKLFPWWTTRQIETILNKLKDEGYLVTGNYNASQYDRTTWYALKCENAETENSFSISQKTGMENSENVNDIIENNNRLPVDNQQIKNTEDPQSDINLLEAAKNSADCEPHKEHFKEIVPEYRECSDLLKKRVLETRQQKITEDTLIKWDNTVRLMVQRDERSLEDIKKIINECHDMPPRPNGFTWRDNILSMDKLRVQWNEGKVYIGMNNNGNWKKQEGGIAWKE